MDEKTRVETDVPGYEEDVETELRLEIENLKGQLKNTSDRVELWYTRYDELKTKHTEDVVRNQIRSLPLLSKFIVVSAELACFFGGLALCALPPYLIAKHHVDAGCVLFWIPGMIMIAAVYARAESRLK